MGGLVVPYLTPQTTSGQYLFGNLTDVMQRRCLTGFLCQVCGRQLRAPAILFARESDLVHRCTVEPACCAVCAAYSTKACPMLSGRMEHWRASRHPAVADTPPAVDGHLRIGAPAERWYAVWVRLYDLIDHPAQAGTLAASWARVQPVRVRPVTTRKEDH